MVKDGMTIMVGGFLAVGSADKILEEIAKGPAKNLTVICNDAAYPERGSGRLIAAGKVKKMILSHMGTNPLAVSGFNEKTLEVEFSPQGTLAERVRAGGAGLGGVLTPTGIGTVVEEGKQKLTIDGKEYLLEKPLHADIALLGANIADESGNLIYKASSSSSSSARESAGANRSRASRMQQIRFMNILQWFMSGLSVWREHR